MGHGIMEFDTGFTTENTWHMHANYNVTGAAVTLDNVLDTFDFQIRPQELFLADGTAVEDKKALVRTGGRAGDQSLPLSVMGNGYVAHSYADYFGRLHHAMTQAGAEVVTVGSLQNGRKAFMSVKLPDGYGDLDFPGWSKVQNVINFGDSVDGTTTTTAAQAINVVVCCNTFAAYLLGAPRLWKIAHRKNAKGKIDQAIENLGNAIAETTAIKEAVERFTNEAFTEAQFFEILENENMMPTPGVDATAAQVTRHTNIMDSVVSRYHGSDIAQIQNTKMGALMAVQGWEQHLRQVNGTTEATEQGIRTGRNINRTVFGAKTDTYTETMAGLLIDA